MTLTECLIFIRQGALIFPVFLLYSIFIYSYYVSSYSSPSWGKRLFSVCSCRVLALLFLPILSESLLLIHAIIFQKRTSDSSAPPVLFTIPFVLAWFCHSLTLIKFSFLPWILHRDKQMRLVSWLSWYRTSIRVVQTPFSVDIHPAISMARSSSVLGSKDNLLAHHHAAQNNFVICRFHCFHCSTHAQIADNCTKSRRPHLRICIVLLIKTKCWILTLGFSFRL